MVVLALNCSASYDYQINYNNKNPREQRNATPLDIEENDLTACVHARQAKK
jgi:hypothetical protein